MRREWSDSRGVLEDMLGHAVTVGSVPGGYFSPAVARAAGDAGLRVLFTSEPTTQCRPRDDCTLIGRFTIRRGHRARHGAAVRRSPSPWARCGAWASWNAKALVKPLLGPAYARVADWLLATEGIDATMVSLVTGLVVAGIGAAADGHATCRTSASSALAAVGDARAERTSAPELPRRDGRDPAISRRRAHDSRAGRRRPAEGDRRGEGRRPHRARAAARPIEARSGCSEGRRPVDRDRVRRRSCPTPGRRVAAVGRARRCRSSWPRTGYRRLRRSPARITTASSALEIAPKAGVVRHHAGRSSATTRRPRTRVPHHIIVDRCYLHGDAQAGGRRGVALNARHAAVIDSYLSDFKEVGADSQAIVGLERSGAVQDREQLPRGGRRERHVRRRRSDDSRPRARRTSRSCATTSPSRCAGRSGDPTFEGTEWAVKNLFELKNARRVLIDGNLFEYNWPQAQNGFAILFTVRNQDGGAPVVGGRRRHVHRTTSCATSRPASTCSGATTTIRASRRGASRSATTCSSTSAARGATAGCSSCSTARSGVTHRSQHGVPDRQHPVRRRPRAAHRVRLPEQHRAAQRVRHHRLGHRRRHRDARRATFPDAVVPPQRHRRRQRRPSIRPTTSFRRRSTRSGLADRRATATSA